MSFEGKVEKKLTVLLYQVSGDVTVTREFSNHDKGKKIKTYFRKSLNMKTYYEGKFDPEGRGRKPDI